MTRHQSRSAWPGRLRAPLSTSGIRTIYSQILWVAQRSIMAGCTSTKFCPGSSLTRGQLAKSLDEGLNLPPTSTDYYSDDENSRFEGAINRLTAAGLTSGCGGGKYCPGQAVRRGPLATALARALRLPATGTDYFDDDDGSPHESEYQPARSRRHHPGLRRSPLLPERQRPPGCGDRVPAQGLRLAPAVAGSAADATRPSQAHGAEPPPPAWASTSASSGQVTTDPVTAPCSTL